MNQSINKIRNNALKGSISVMSGIMSAVGEKLSAQSKSQIQTSNAKAAAKIIKILTNRFSEYSVNKSDNLKFSINKPKYKKKILTFKETSLQGPQGYNAYFKIIKNIPIRYFQYGLK